MSRIMALEADMKHPKTRSSRSIRISTRYLFCIRLRISVANLAGSISMVRM